MNEQPQIPTKYCHACATLLDARAEICPRCGVRQAAPPQPSHANTWFLYVIAAIVFALIAYAVFKNGGG